MRTLTSRHLRVTAVALAAGLALAACSSSDPEPEATAGSSPATVEDVFPVTLENTFGTTTIEAAPERVATVAWGNHDVPIALGIVPVGIAASTYGDDDADGVLPWTFDALEGLGATGDSLPALFDETDGIDFEGVANVTPDVVLASYSGLSQEDWTTLSGIAPTVSFPEVAWGTNWKDMALINGRALGLEEEAQAKVDEVLAQIDAALAERPDVEGKSVVYTWIDPADKASIWIYTPIDARVQYLSDLGMTVPASVDKLADETSFGVTLSAENADELSDADILVTYGDDTTLAWLQADPLLSKIPAVERGSVVVLPNSAPISAATSGPTILSVPWALNDYLDLFEAAASKVQ